MNINHEIHGDSTHDTTIYLVEKILKQDNCQLRDKRFFKDKALNAGEPDVFYMRKDKITRGGKKTPITSFFVVEVQHQMTPKIIQKKVEQYQMAGIDDVVFINPNEYPRITELTGVLKDYTDWLEKRIP